ncbi:hypothetical protein ACFODO_03900 [Acinetobacter sichuanensis]|uniref:Uncharacterized protein n=1 Tax=Acinetobacter sichuanensis TaxID=2136183 RepID=A0A371YLM3_9GAMM|nr:hypothetical protein [Acinetobacter sichuanensis]RFC82399.1 hypothetical protein C9E89_016895 [Acinetobacter sichuanensis]
MSKINAVLLDKHPIHGVIHTAKGELKPFPILEIDDLPLNQWMDRLDLNILSNELSGLSLVPAQGWLMDEHENKIAWELLKTTGNEECSTIVPLLICPDELDYTCTVVVVEQIQKDTQVIWNRFGLGLNAIGGVVTAVRWITGESILEFNRDEFDNSISRLIDLDSQY